MSGGRFHRTGGNTTCVEICAGGHRVVLDGGTGLQALGATLGAPADLTLLFTHVHWDHIQGVPFFAPLYHPGTRIRMVGARWSAGRLEDVLSAQMRPPQFPVTFDAFRARIAFSTLGHADALEVGPFRITAGEMSHPDGVAMYRVEAGGRAVVFATDIEHGDRLDPRLLRFAEGADLLVHDAQYREVEYLGLTGMPRTGWGHSTWEQAVAAATTAGATRVALFHHDPTRTDDEVAVIEGEARRRHVGAVAAREGEVISL